MDRKRTLLLAGIVLLVVTLPYGYAALQSDSRAVFQGFLANQFDGYSYLAKMYQGREGSWLFTLPFTAEPGEGTFMFTYYLFLGHAARWTGVGLIWIFHLARVLAAVFLVFAISGFFRQTVFPEQPRAARLATLLAVFGSGLGWITALAGLVTADFWVAEAYPFLSMYTNPHFPLGLGLLLTIFRLALLPLTPRRGVTLFLLGTLLAIILPFGLVIAGAMLGGKFVWDSIEMRSFRPWKYIPLFAGGLPVVAYQFYVSATHPVLAGWNAQNITTSPPLWDFLISFSPALLFGLLGLRSAWQNRSAPGMRLVLVWFVLGALLAYIPLSLQRRFFMAYYIPTAAMAIIGLQSAQRVWRRKWLAPALFVLSVLTPVMLLTSEMISVRAQPYQLYWTAEERAALDWIGENTPPDALILTGPDTGASIPAITGRRVLYGHAFETANAIQEKATVIGVFSGRIDPQKLIAERGVDYVLVGPREHKLGNWTPPQSLKVVFAQGIVTIYQVEETP